MISFHLIHFHNCGHSTKGEPPNSEMHPMRVLFLIPKNNSPQLTGNYSKQFKEFIDLCLNKDPENRPTAKELASHPFIKKAKRNNHLMDLIDRYKKWRLNHSRESDSESESDQKNNSDDSDWNMTVKDNSINSPCIKLEPVIRLSPLEITSTSKS